jgi:serine/threonine-protein kinase
MGTPMYMSPQQAQGMPLDHRTDIWSLGAVIYEALTGSPPWEPRDTYEQMIIQIVTQKPRPTWQLAPDVSEALARVVDATLQHDLAARTQDAATLAKELAEAAKVPAPASARSLDATIPAFGPPGSGPAVSVRSSPQHPTPPPTGVGVVVARTQPEEEPKRRPATMLLAIGGLVAAVAVIAGVVVGTRRTDPPKITGNALVPQDTASTAPSAAASTAASAAPTSTTTLLPLATESAVASASPPTSASTPTMARPTTTAVSTKPIAKPAGIPAAGTSATGSRPGQYGAAGVSTSY